MNAKEFAHELEKAASFIRQQQAEIEALKNRNWDLVSEPWGFDRRPADLTDEEINELWLITCSKAGEVDDMQLHFARAILRKAQE